MSDVDDDLGPRPELTELLTRLADDPDAPPSSVSALSVIAAARAEARTAATDAMGASSGDKPPAPPSTGSTSRRHRPGRRRLFIGGLVAAASLAAIAAVVVPVTMSGNSSNTSADSARVATAANPPAAEQSAAALAPAPGSAGSSGGAGATGEQEAGGAADTAGDASAAGAAAGAAGCWPELTESASDALLDALPPGEFEGPIPLTADCGPAPVGGAVLGGTEPGTVLVVRVSAAEPGACLTDLADPCALQSGAVYLAADAAGVDTAYVYGNGFEVAVGGWPAVGDSVAVLSGLTTDELVAAAQAVLGTLG